LTSRTVVHLVPHTHWDREWYLPFQSFRMRLVDLIDALLDEMDADERARFTLDGQTATVDDYLEVRPENAARLARLVAMGRLAVGPWRILMDEFLVSGETMIRNLQLGIRRGDELGGAMPVGYLPDMFGHVAQMPQILRRAGIADAVVWRGVPSAIDRHAFLWSAPDGSTVRCEYLLGGYGNGHDLLAIPDRIERRFDAFIGVQRAAFGDNEILAMYGEDHAIPAPGYARLVASFNERQDRYEMRIETLAEYIAMTHDRAAPELTWTGELRSSARANILMGVASHRIDVKQAAGRAERLLERVAEPLLAIHGGDWPVRLLEIAWRRVVDNSAHDSICACSSEETVAQVLSRYAEAEQIGRGLADEALNAIGRHTPAGAFAAVNPSPVERTDMIELDLPLEASAADGPIVLPDGSPVPTQDLGVFERTVVDVDLAARDAAPYLRRRLHGQELFGYKVIGWRLPSGQTETIVTVDVDHVQESAPPDIDALLDDVAAASARTPDAAWRLRVATRPRRRLLALVPVPALGWTAVRPATAASVVSTSEPARRMGRSLANGLVSVTVAEDGTLAIDGSGVSLAGVGRLVDGGDVGDSYNFAPPVTDRSIEHPYDVRVEAGESGPLRAGLTVIRRFAWPAGLIDDGSRRMSETVDADVRVAVELRSREPFVRLAIAFENRAIDHRLRFHVPMLPSADRTFAEGQFAVVERGTVVEGGHGEMPIPTFPAHRLVAADGAAILLEHVLEYELVDGPELALTVLRATGLISRDPHPYRDEPAGPAIAAPTGQGLGPRSLSFALLPTSEGRPSATVLAELERYRNPFLVATGNGPTGLESRSAEGLAIDGEGVILSSLRRRGSALEARLVNEQATPARATLRGPFTSIAEVDFLGRLLGPPLSATGRAEIELGPWEIKTLSLGARR
jgi:2-O-(6-phospho-alpha-D-mannosyl)-D-glycerate hydrolase